MRIVFRKKVPGQIEFGLIYGGIALLLLLSAGLFPILSFFPPCAFKGLVGIPCPTCGSTRSVALLAHGDLLAAFVMNPLTAFTLTAAVLFFLYSLITLAFDFPRFGIFFSKQEGTAVRAGIIGLVLAQWVYLAFTL